MTASTRVPAMADFEPPALLRSPRLQTLIGSRGRGRWVTQRAAPMLAVAERRTITTSDGAELEAWISRRSGEAPSVILIHGWLGHADSSYVLSAAAALWEAGFTVIRLNLRDHGDTAHLNREMFHSARIQEVVDAVTAIEAAYATGPCGLAGFSLGGNFALRVARAHPIETVAVCPAMDPTATMDQIDNGWFGYRLFFVRKWHRALRAKQRAFPDHYEFDRALQLRTVSALTELFVAEHTGYASTADYFDAYALTGPALEGTIATLIYACDDPVIPAAGFDNLPDSLTLMPVTRGGHCAFVEHPMRPAWIDRTLAAHFRSTLHLTPGADSQAP